MTIVKVSLQCPKSGKSGSGDVNHIALNVRGGSI